MSVFPTVRAVRALCVSAEDMLNSRVEKTMTSERLPPNQSKANAHLYPPRVFPNIFDARDVYSLDDLNDCPATTASNIRAGNIIVVVACVKTYSRKDTNPAAGEKSDSQPSPSKKGKASAKTTSVHRPFHGVTLEMHSIFWLGSDNMASGAVLASPTKRKRI